MVIPPETLARFEGVTTLCHCWKLTPKNEGLAICATDHDRPVSFGGDPYQPGLALETSHIRRTLSMAPEALDLSGALEADGLTAEDLADGVWDGASLVIYRVDWADPSYGIWLWSGNLTSVEETGGAFTVQLASSKAGLERTIGRNFGRRCDADLGDVRCGIALEQAPEPVCDKRFATCRDVFANQDNFRGFPHMPGNDAVISGPGEKRDGSSRRIEH